MSKVQQAMLNSLSFEDTSVAFASKNNAQLRKTYIIFALMSRSWLVKIGTFFIKLFIMLGLPIKKIVKPTVFWQFCGGETIKECQNTIDSLGKSHIGTILDYSVEGEDSEKSFDDTAREIIQTIEKAKQQTAIPFCVFKVTGIVSSELLEKNQKKISFDSDEHQSYNRAIARVNSLCQKAHEVGVKIFIDAEESWIQDSIDAICYEMMQRYNTQSCIVYNTYQMYRWESLENLKEAYLLAQSKGCFLGVKLVRGAYMEKERTRAHEEEYREPIHATKEDTDRDFNLAIDFCIENHKIIAICLGTHNEYSSHYLAQRMEQAHIQHNHSHFWFAQLLGMSDNISYNLSRAGYNVAKYVPYGPVNAVMPYLFRRAAENTSIAGQTSREFSLVQKELERRKASH